MRQSKKDIPGNPPPEPKEPIFLERGDGLGWTLNFDRPVSYLILAAILALLVFGILYATEVIRF